MEVISLPTKDHVDRGQLVNGEWTSSTSGGALGYDFTPDAINVCFYGFYIETVLVYPFEHDAEENFVYPCNLTVKDIFGNVSTKQIVPYSWNVLEIGNIACMSIQMGDGREYSKSECYDENDEPMPGRKYIRSRNFKAWYSQWVEGTDYIETNNMISPADGIKTPLPHSIWRLEDGLITITRFPEAAASLHEPLPYSLWRLTPDERDYIFHRRLPDHLPPEPPEPVDVEPVKQRPYICIFSKYTQQNLFYTHGKAILHPTKCLITEELNGKYNLIIEHPIDDTGLWEYIRENNIIKALGQLFTIRLVKQSWNGKKGKVTATADHIFYHMADQWIPMGSSITTNLQSVQALIDVAKTYIRTSTHYEGEVIYEFQQLVGADMAYPGYYVNDSWLPDLDFNSNHWADLKTGINPVDFLMGSDSIISNVGGELYRDNFNFAITNRKLYSKDNAFELRVGKNVTGISRTIDMTNFVTAITAKNNYGTSIYQDVSPAHVRNTYGVEFAHPVIRDKYYSYDYPDTIPYETRHEYAYARLNRDKQRYMDEHVPPNIVYDIKLKDLKNVPEYENFLNQSDFTVGNTGCVYDERLSSSAIKLKVTRTVRNAITDEVEEVSFGKLQKLSS